jgi:hypothetical protein
MRFDFAECSEEVSRGSDKDKRATEVLGVICRALRIFRLPLVDRQSRQFWTSLFPPATNNICGMTVMADFDDRPPPAAGAYWVKEEDYPALLKVSDDGKKMPQTWEEWLKMAEEMERGLKAYGHVVMRVHIDPKTFPDWCAAHGTSPGREGRKRFVAAAVAERYGDQS